MIILLTKSPTVTSQKTYVRIPITGDSDSLLTPSQRQEKTKPKSNGRTSHMASFKEMALYPAEYHASKQDCSSPMGGHQTSSSTS